MKRFFFAICVFAQLIFNFGRAADYFGATDGIVGPTANGLVTPVNQVVTPAGIQVELPGMRPQAIALSPDGKILVTAGLTHELVIVEPATGKILQRVTLPAGKTQDAKPVSSEILNP